MVGIIAAVLFAIALLFELAKLGGDVINSTTLTTAGLLCLALHLAGIGGRWRARRRR